MDLLMEILGVVSYTIPAPALMWGWWRWLMSSPRFGPPKWRTAAAFCGLLIASIVGVAVLICSVHVNERPRVYLTDAAVIKWGNGDLFMTGLALVASLVGKGPARLPACLASVGLTLLWITIPVIMY